MTKEEFRSTLHQYAEYLIIKKKRHQRQKQIDLINYKLHGETKYQDKNGFFEFQIEN